MNCHATFHHFNQFHRCDFFFCGTIVQEIKQTSDMLCTCTRSESSVGWHCVFFSPPVKDKTFASSVRWFNTFFYILFVLYHYFGCFCLFCFVFSLLNETSDEPLIKHVIKLSTLLEFIHHIYKQAQTQYSNIDLSNLRHQIRWSWTSNKIGRNRDVLLGAAG